MNETARRAPYPPEPPAPWAPSSSMGPRFVGPRPMSVRQGPLHPRPGLPGRPVLPIAEVGTQPVRRPPPPRPPVPRLPAPPPPAPPRDAYMPADPDAGDPVPVRRRRSVFGRILTVLGLIVLVAVAGAGTYLCWVALTPPATAVAGDCVVPTAADDVRVVGCGDPGAQFRVVGTLENRMLVDAVVSACAEFPEATSAFWQAGYSPSDPGLVLCLMPAA